jgi:hypothetical protein
MRTEHWRKDTPGLHLVGKGENGSVSTIFGPVKAGLITTHRTREVQLSELLNSLEREVENLNSKYCEAYVTLVSVMEHLAKLSAIIINETTIDNSQRD